MPLLDKDGNPLPERDRTTLKSRQSVQPDAKGGEFAHVTLTFGRDAKWAWAEMLPIAKDQHDKRRREKMFASWDLNNNGKLSLNEVETALRFMMGEFATTAKPVALLAFTHGKDENRDQAGKHDMTMIEPNEFRMLLVYLRNYFGLYHAFVQIDGQIEQDGRE